jgi:hypothetical protein
LTVYFFTIILIYLQSLLWTVGFTALYIFVTAVVTMNRITISLIFLIVISMVLPTSAIMYARGQTTDNSDNLRSATGESTDNSDNLRSATGESTDNSGSSTTGGGTTTTTNPDNSGSSTTGGGTTVSNSTGNTQGEDIIGSILTIHNRERAAVAVPALVWSDKLAAGAKNWAEQMVTTAGFAHSTCCGAFKNYGEGIAGIQNATNSGIIDGEERWIAEKNDPGYHGGPFYPDPKSTNGAPGHYTQIVWKSTTEVGCGIAPPGNALGFMVLVCQYNPPGNIFGQPAY